MFGAKSANLLRTWMGAMQTLIRIWKGAMQTLLDIWSQLTKILFETTFILGGCIPCVATLENLNIFERDYLQFGD